MIQSTPQANGIRPPWCRLLALAVLLTIGCAGGPAARRPDAVVDSVRPAPRSADGPPQHPAAGQTRTAETIEQRLRFEVRQWSGTPHRLGGTSRRGIDCSGFVQMLHRRIFNRRIPRSTALQVKAGRAIGVNQLDAGDLVFFKLPHGKRHVGIYLGRADFAHASASKGVTVSCLTEPYWRDAFWTARRYATAAN